MIAVTALLVLAGCATVEIADGLTPAELFQRAQEAAASNDFALSARYYQAFLDRYPADEFPQEFPRRVWADYELAFLQYKQGYDETALQLFGELLDRYDGDNAAVLPTGPRTLAERVIGKIEASKVTEERGTAPN